MVGRFLRWGGVAILIAGVAIYTLAPGTPVPDATGTPAGPWTIAAAYFAMIAGAVTLGLGWVQRRL